MKKKAVFSNESSRSGTPAESRRALLAGPLARRGASVRRSVEALLSAQRLCLDPERVALRAMALAVALGEERERDADPCSAPILRRAVEELVGEQAWDVLSDAPLERSPSAAFYRALARTLGLEAAATRAACAERNRRPRATAPASWKTRERTERTRPSIPRGAARVAERPNAPLSPGDENPAL